MGKNESVPIVVNPPRCGAKTRLGTSCKAPAANGYKRCRMHGGAKGSGAPKGNRNALKHGAYTKQAIDERRSCLELARAAFIVLDYFDRAAETGTLGSLIPNSKEITAMNYMMERSGQFDIKEA